jgi:hypothetical protein
LDGKAGIFYKKGTIRTRKDGTIFKFKVDTFEVDFKDLISLPVSERIQNLPGFGINTLH